MCQYFHHRSCKVIDKFGRINASNVIRVVQKSINVVSFSIYAFNFLVVFVFFNVEILLLVLLAKLSRYFFISFIDIIYVK